MGICNPPSSRRDDLYLFLVQPFHLLFDQPQGKISASGSEDRTHDQPAQITILNWSIEEAAQPDGGNEQTERDRQIKHRYDLPQASHAAGIHLARIIPCEVRPERAKCQQNTFDCALRPGSKSAESFRALSKRNPDWFPATISTSR